MQMQCFVGRIHFLRSGGRLMTGGGIGNVELIDLGNWSVAAPGGGALGPNPNGLSVYIQNFAAGDQPAVTKIFQSLLASLFTNYF